ncbi:MAG TPA: GNAT family N-acetyltransferase [Holophagaceae bacterium]|nr:GNAT family N-acetyltransferase [Holophagaceae bacterium]
MDAFHLRAAIPEDARALSELASRTFQETFGSNYAPEDLEAFLASAYALPKIARELADPSYSCFVAERGGSLAGYALLHDGTAESCVHGPAPIELERIYVLRAALGAGLGQALLDRCAARAREMGKRTLWLGVWERNDRAQAFYRRNGFVEVGDHRFQVGSMEDRDLVFEKRLD